jgi:hypothetical protein
MTPVQRLLANYTQFVSIPWAANAAGAQRIWFAVYPPAEERRLRARLTEFEIATRDAKQGWKQVDITHLPARWIASNSYREAYFASPSALALLEQDLKNYAVEELREVCRAKDVDAGTVISVIGVGGLFGFAHVSSVTAELEADIRGRLLVFFPGEYERNMYRFMDARDGFNYMAAPITCSERLFL